MENSSAIQASLAGRYASALFDLARENSKIEPVEKDLKALASLVDSSSDAYSIEFDGLLKSQTVSRGAALAVMKGIGSAMSLDLLTVNFLGVLAENGRLNQLIGTMKAFNQLAADYRGEVHADVTSAFPLNDQQRKSIADQLNSYTGRKVIISEKVDNDILGGLIVRIGSQMIDNSIKTRLNTLSQAMKG